jgi:outer membrane protein W
MKRIFVLLFCLFGFAASQAQIHEIGIFAGGSNYVGDVGPTTYISPNSLALGILYKWNRSPRHSWRISFVESTLKSNDKDSDSEARKLRGYSFENDVKELSLGLEFNFFDFNLHESKTKVTPYIYSGLSYLFYTEKFFVNNETKSEGQKGTLAIPMTLGIKSNIMENWVLGIEVGARWSFSDDLDGSNPKNDDLETLRFGNINNKDWYVFSGITLTYTFGNKPCYCAD